MTLFDTALQITGLTTFMLAILWILRHCVPSHLSPHPAISFPSQCCLIIPSLRLTNELSPESHPKQVFPKRPVATDPAMPNSSLASGVVARIPTFSLQHLQLYDGERSPSVYISLCVLRIVFELGSHIIQGDIYDVSSSKHLYGPRQPFHIYAGSSIGCESF